MPNWCDNSISIEGKAVDIKRFDDQFKAKHVGYRGGSSYNPTEEQIKNSNWIEYKRTKDSSGSDVCHFINEIKEVEGYSFSNFVPMTKEDFLDGWREWTNDNWGTKWDTAGNDTFNSGLDLVDDALKNNEPDTLIEVFYSFDTAWSPCEPVVAAMAKKFPELLFTHEYDEGGVGYAGVTKYRYGEEFERKESGDNYRKFLVEELERDEDFVKCPSCGEYLEEYEIEDNDWECPECDMEIPVP